MAQLIPMLLKEMENEAKTTRKMLACIPADKYDWKPHAKSMSIRQLATHIAELPLWVTMSLTTEGLDFQANPYVQEKVDTNEEMMIYFEASLANGKAQLEKANEDLLEERWVLRSGEHILSESSKGEVIRMTYNQIVHHRAQLGVNLRLLDVAIPGSYGPSADEMGM